MTAGVVRRVFGWFVHDRLTVMEIVRRLNDDTDIPLPPRSKTGAWTREVVARVLRNPLYRGWLRYGVTESVGFRPRTTRGRSAARSRSRSNRSRTCGWSRIPTGTRPKC
ncbi:recombinase family protein [Fimbriiglobus ruber]|uniref:Recombinase domain-containing protein n=1 Tax=Fimbriiglobus ruber TaxID=1908690 RepID=A0A225DCR3_9BACT|nr:recombinase family protein [Fimbriiglobus ruber]OWK39331.1 hypothetical protein FRUB_05894 [Fimbriiglobus ruber]